VKKDTNYPGITSQFSNSAIHSLILGPNRRDNEISDRDTACLWGLYIINESYDQSHRIFVKFWSFSALVAMPVVPMRCFSLEFILSDEAEQKMSNVNVMSWHIVAVFVYMPNFGMPTLSQSASAHRHGWLVLQSCMRSILLCRSVHPSPNTTMPSLPVGKRISSQFRHPRYLTLFG
jgi:hypothetical protein